jgi:hypothetical protein
MQTEVALNMVITSVEATGLCRAIKNARTQGIRVEIMITSLKVYYF